MDVVTPVDVRMGSLHRLDHISANVNVLQLVLPGDVGKSIHLWVLELFQVVWRGALDNVNGDEAVVVAGDLPASIDGGLHVCIVGSHSVHEEVALERSRWESTWHRCGPEDCEMEILKCHIFVGHCHSLSSVGINSGD